MRSEVLKELKFLNGIRNYLITLEEKNKNNDWPKFLSVIVFAGAIAAFTLLSIFFLTALSLIFDSFDAYLSGIRGYNGDKIFSLGGILSILPSILTVVFIERKVKKNRKAHNDICKKIRDEFPEFKSFNNKEVLKNLRGYYNKESQRFKNDIKKADIALHGIKEGEKDFISFREIIMELTEEITQERAKNAEYRIEASRRLGDSEEEQERLLKIVES